MSAQRVEEPVTVLEAVDRVRAYNDDVFIETPPAEADLKTIVGAFDDTLGFIDQTVYANEDNDQGVTWRNDEVLELLAEIRRALVGEGAS